MIYQKQCKNVIKRMITEALRDETVSAFAIDDEGDVLASSFDGVSNVVDLIFEVDAATLFFSREATGEGLGAAFINLDYDALPDEIICDYTDNDFMRRIANHALGRSKPRGLEDIHTRTEPHITF